MRREWLIPLYVLFFLALISVTPFTDMFTRYLIPLTPFLCLFLFEAVIWLKRNTKTAPFRLLRIAGCFLVVLVSCLCLLQAPFYLKDMYMRYHQQVVYHDRQGRMVEYRLFFYDEPCRALDAGLDWLNSKAQPSDIVAASMPHWVYLRTGLKTVMPPFEPIPRESTSARFSFRQLCGLGRHSLRKAGRYDAICRAYGAQRSRLLGARLLR